MEQMTMRSKREKKRIPLHIVPNPGWDDESNVSELSMGSSEFSVTEPSTSNSLSSYDISVTANCGPSGGDSKKTTLRWQPACLREKTFPPPPFLKKIGILPPMRPKRITSVGSTNNAKSPPTDSQNPLPCVFECVVERSSSSFLEEDRSSTSLRCAGVPFRRQNSKATSSASKYHFPASMRRETSKGSTSSLSFKKLGILPPTRPNRLVSVEEGVDKPSSLKSSISFKKLGILPPTRPKRLISVEDPDRLSNHTTNHPAEKKDDSLLSTTIGRPHRISLSENRSVISRTT